MEVIYHTAATEEDSSNLEYQPPKNIRQVGSPSAKRKIYMEDYVMTYLSKLAMPSNTYARGAILLGTLKRTREGTFIFISGALEAQNFELDLDETVFTNENWAEIYSQIREFFPKLSIVGWFVSRLGFSTELTSKMIKIQNNYFAGENKVLYMIDSLENEDAFYLYENDGLKRQKGYYIYYEKNEEMQSYMISKNEGKKKSAQEKQNVVKRDQAVIASYRKAFEKKAALFPKGSQKAAKSKGAKKESGFYYAASSFLTIAILAVGITVINNYDKMVLLEATISQIAEDAKGGEQEVIANIPQNTESEAKGEEQFEEETTSTETASTETESTEQQGNIQEPKKEAEREAEPPSNSDGNNAGQAVKTAADSIATYYIVKEGDTMISISKKMFQTEKYAKEILNANQMSEDDTIFPGQKIIIPTIE